MGCPPQGVWLYVGCPPQGVWLHVGCLPQGVWLYVGCPPQGVWLYVGSSPQGVWLYVGCSPQGVWLYLGVRTYEASTTTATPVGWTASVMATAICLVNRSCTEMVKKVKNTVGSFCFFQWFSTKKYGEKRTILTAQTFSSFYYELIFLQRRQTKQW